MGHLTNEALKSLARPKRPHFYQASLSSWLLLMTLGVQLLQQRALKHQEEAQARRPFSCRPSRAAGKQRVNQNELTNWQRLCFSHDPTTPTISRIVLERGIII